MAFLVRAPASRTGIPGSRPAPTSCGSRWTRGVTCACVFQKRKVCVRACVSTKEGIACMCVCAHVFQKTKVLRACLCFKKGRYCMRVCVRACVFQKRKVLCACVCVSKNEGIACMCVCERVCVLQKRKVIRLYNNKVSYSYSSHSSSKLRWFNKLSTADKHTAVFKCTANMQS